MKTFSPALTRWFAAFVLMVAVAQAQAHAQTVTPMVSAGNHHSLVLTEKGEVYGLGRNDFGALGLGNTNRIDIPGIASHANLAGKTIADIELSFEGGYTLILTTDGQVFSMGDNGRGQCGHPTTQSRINEPTRITQSGIDTVIVRDIAVGNQNSLLATNRGIYVFGNNLDGYLGTGNTISPVSTPTRLTQSNVNLVPFKFIESSGQNNPGATYAIADNDSIFVWGRNSNGELGLGDAINRLNPELLSKSRFGGKKVSKFSSHNTTVLALTEDGKAYFWGYRGGTGFEGTSDLSTDILIPALINHASVSGKTLVDVAYGTDHGLLIAFDGSVFAFGNNSDGQLGLGDKAIRTVPTAVNTAFFQGKAITKVFAGLSNSYFLASDGTAFVSGSPAPSGSGFSNNALTPLLINTVLFPGETITKIRVKHDDHMKYMVTISGKILSFDEGYYRSVPSFNQSLFLRDHPVYSRPTKLPLTNLAGKTVSKVFAGDHKSFLITTDGKVYGTGQAAFGGLGITDSLDVFDPVLLDQTHISGKKIIEIATSGNTNWSPPDPRSHTLLLADDGTVYAFGSNNNGQLGLGDNTNRRIPTPVTTNLSGKTIVHIAVGRNNSMAIASDGSVYLWGKGGLGEMGFGNTNDLNVPTLATHVSSLGKTFVKGAIGDFSPSSSGFPHFLLLASDGTVYGFGENSNGQLGLGNGRVDQYTPTLLTASSISGKKIVDVSVSINGATMLRAGTGEVYGMGRAISVGFLVSEFTNYDVPSLINSAEVTGRRVTGISILNRHSMVLLEDGRVLTAVAATNGLIEREGILGNSTTPTEVRLHLPIQDFTTYASPIPTGNLTLHLDASRMGFTTSNDSVSTWQNLADSTKNAVHPGLSVRPLRADSAINNRPAIRFNGTNNYFNLPSIPALGLQNSDYEIFLVAKSASPNTNLQFLLSAPSEQIELHTNNGQGVRFIPVSGKYVDAGTTGQFTDGASHLYNLRVNDTQAALSMNLGTLVTNAGSGRTSLSTSVFALGVRQGGNFYFAGDIAEVIIYNKVLSPAERDSVETHLMAKYAIQNFKNSTVQLTGSEGWRMLTSPISDSTLAPLLRPLWTQGFTGADVPHGNPNVYTWATTGADANASHWTALSSINQAVTPGTGILMYVFSDDNGPGVAGNAGFPKSIPVAGPEPSQDVALTSRLNPNTNGWTLLGNPFRNNVAWGSLTRSGLSNSVYVYDHNSASWKSWNGITGSLSQGRLGAFNAFFVQTLSASPTLTIPREAINTGATAFLGKTSTGAPPVFALRAASSSGLDNTVWFAFSPDGLPGIDASDAYKMAPYTARYILLSSVISDTTLLDIDHRPLPASRLSLPLALESTETGTHTLSLTDAAFPETWSLTLTDHVTGTTTGFNEPYTFSHGAGKARPAGPGLLQNPVLQTTGTAPRFTLTLDPGATTSIDEPALLPRTVALGANFPNPFNPGTRIPYALPAAAHVRIDVYDLNGRRVATLVNEPRPAGYHHTDWNASLLASGVYMVQLTTSNQRHIRKITLIK